MKKLVSLFLIFVMAVSLAACGGTPVESVVCGATVTITDQAGFTVELPAESCSGRIWREQIPNLVRDFGNFVRLIP